MAEKVLVTGGAGFIGSHVVDAYVEAGLEVVVVDDLSTGREAHLNPKARFYKMDIRDPGLAQVFRQEQPDYVNHHAALASVRLSVEDPARDADINIRGSINMLEGCRRSGVKKVIYSSSGGVVYGEPEYLPCDEAQPIKPLCPYGVAKYATELYLHLYHHLYGLRYTILRYPNIYGPRQDPLGEAGVVAIFCRQMLEGAPVTINGTGEQERDFLYVEDAARANLLALEQGDSRAYNLGWGRGISVNQICARLREFTGYPGQARYGPPKPGEVFRIYLSAARAERELGWHPRVALEEGLARTATYFRDGGS